MRKSVRGISQRLVEPTGKESILIGSIPKLFSGTHRAGKMPLVFISYSRSETQMVARRLRESLARQFGDAAIFRDKNSIAAGEDWMKAIKEELTRGHRGGGSHRAQLDNSER